MAVNTITTKGVLIINGKQVENTFNKLYGTTRKLEKELKKLKPGTTEFLEKAKQVKLAREAFSKVKNEINAVGQELNKTGGYVSSFIGRFGGIKNIFSTLFAGGAIFTVKDTIDDLLAIADAITNVVKTSGLATEQVNELWHEFSELDTRTSKMELMQIAEIGGRLGISDKDELKAFTEEIDKAYVALGDSFSGGLDAVTTKLGKMKNIFSETKDLGYDEAVNQIGSALNELAAKGTSSEENISDFAMRVGQLPDSLKPAADKVLGLGAAFEESGLDAQIASSGYSRFMTSAASNIDAFAYSMNMGVEEAKKLLNEKPEEFFIRFSQGMNGLDATTTAKIFKSLKLNTQEITKAVGAAGQNAGRFYEMMKFSGEAMEDATSLSDEFDKKNNNSAAIWVKITKTLKDFVTDGVVPELFDSFSSLIGKVTGVSKEGANGIKTFTSRLSFLVKTVTVAVVALFSYKAAVALVAVITGKATQQTILYNTVQKISTSLKKMGTAATYLYAAAKFKLAGNTKKATAAMRAFNIVTKLNPWGLLLAGIVAVVTAMALYSKETNKLSIEKQALLDAEKEAASQTAVQKNNLKQLLKVAQDNTKSVKERQEAVDKLNEIVPEYNGNLTIEAANTKEATKQLDRYIERLKDAAREKFLKTLVDKKAEEIAKIEHSSLDDNITWYEKTWNALKSVGNMYNYVGANILTAAKNKKKLLDVSDEELKKLNQLLDKQKQKNKNNGSVVDPLNPNKDPDKDPDKDSPKKNNKTLDYYKKALDEQEKTNKKFLDLENKLQEENLKIQEDSLQKQLELLAIEFDRKKAKYTQENAEIQKAIVDTNAKMSALREKKAKKSTSSKEKEEINKALEVYDAINKKRIAAKKVNDEILMQLESTRQFKAATLKDKWFIKDLERERKKREKEKELAIDKINTIASFEEAKQKLQDEYGVTDLSKIKTIVDAKNKLREEANKRALEDQVKFLEKTASILNEELKTITGPAAEQLQQNLQILEEKMTKIKGVLQGKADEEGEGTDLGEEAGSLDILGFTAQQWVDTFEKLETTEQKIAAVKMAMQALANAGAMFAEHQKRLNAKELKDFTRYQKRRKKMLKNQLNSGVITQEQYHREVKKMEREAANKKAEMEYKAAKAEKTSKLISATVNTALAVTSALSAGPIVGLVLAGIVGALGAIQIGMIASQPLPPKTAYADGGFTKGLGFKDETGHEVAGAVHADEYVVPKWLLEEPQVANAVDWIEAKRTKTTASFDNGGYTSENENATFNENNTDYTTSRTDTDVILVYQLSRLNDNLEKLERDGLEAFLLADAKNGKLMHDAVKKFKTIHEKNKR